MAKSIKKKITVEYKEYSIRKIGTKAEAFALAFDGRSFSMKKPNGKLAARADSLEVNIEILLKNGYSVHAMAGEEFSRIPKPSEIKAILIEWLSPYSGNEGWAFWGDEVRICIGRDDLYGDWIDLNFDYPPLNQGIIGPRPYKLTNYYDEVKTFAEI